ncbi:acyltransferase, partial [Morganella morganii]|nr:acyltransferase [Morganella morganii]
MKTTFNNIEKKKNLDSIQAIRGIAALLVMLFHFRVYFNFSFFPVGDFLFSHGEIGVTIFFIISGFIMEYSHSESGVKPALRFAIKRLTRVYPLYFIATMIWVFIIYYFDLNPSILNIENIIKSLSFQPLIGEAPYFGYSSLYVGWTLNYEMMFYFSFFISMLSYKFRTIFFYLFWMLSL